MGIVFIVAGHCQEGGISFFYEWMPIYTFHLGLFAFCTGYLFKIEYEENIFKYIIKKFKKLIIPMYIWNALYICFILIIKNKGFNFGNKELSAYSFFILPWTNGHQYIFTMGLWYVTTLFLIEIFNIFFCKLFKNNSVIIFCIYLILGIFGVYLANSGYNKGIYLVLTRILYLLPFLGLGFLYKNKIEKIDKVNNLIYFFIIFLVLLGILTINKKILRFHPSWMNDFPKNPLIVYVSGFTGIAFWLRIGKNLESIIKNSRIIDIISKSTYSIMVNHFFGFFCLNSIYAMLNKFLIKEFNWGKFKNDIWYQFLPYNIGQYRILYLFFGICIPIIIDLIINYIKNLVSNKFRRSQN